MIGKILLLATAAVASARHFEVEVVGAMVAHERCPAEAHHLLPHEWDCTKFYYCEYGKKWDIARDCAPKTEFSYELQVCVHPTLANCKLPGVPPSEEIEDSSEIATDAPIEVTRPPRPTTAAETVATRPPIPTTEAPTTTEAATRPPRPTTEAPAAVELLPNGCPADFGVHKLLPHETRCDKFYYCVFGDKVARNCAPGTYFNAVLQVCDWAENVDCINTETSESEELEGSGDPDIEIDGLLPNGCPADFDVHKLLPHEDCSKFYYCVLGETVERQCPRDLQFNAELQVCDWPENAGCINAGSEESSGNGETENGNENGSGENEDSSENDNEEASGENGNSGETENGTDGEEATTTSAPITATEVPETELLPNGCPADFDVHQLLPHESECGKFYYCVRGEKVERICAPGTHFNPAEQVCDWPENVNCENSNNSNEDNKDSDENNGSSNENNGNGEESEILDNGCPADFDVHKLLPHEKECGKFYYCVHGQKVERDCAPGTHFNPAIQVCDFPENVLCIGGAGSSVESSSESNQSSKEVEPILPNGCPSDFDIHKLLPHDECGKFYYCVFGEKVERDCAPGTHFNAAEQICDHPENAGCANAGSNENQSHESTENGTQETGSNEEASNENGNEDRCKTSCNVPAWAHDDCDKFWQCDGENTALGTCSEGLHFNAYTHTCDFICNAGCIRDDIQRTPGHDGLKLFLPWNKVDKTIEKLLSERTRH